MGRKLVHAILVILLGTIPMVLGIVVAIGATKPGRVLLARGVSTYLDRMFRGDIEVGAISGSLLFGLTLDDLVIRDTSGVLFASMPHLEVGYSIPNFLANRIILTGVKLVEPTINLIKHRNGRMNYEEILKLGETKSTGAPALVELHDVEMDSGTVRIYLPWRFQDGVDSEAERDAALKAERAKPGRVIEEGPEGLRKVLKADAVTTRLPLLQISTPGRDPLEAELDTLAMRFSDPGVTLRDFAGKVRLGKDSVTLSIERGALPNSEFHGGGVVSFSQGTLLYDLALDVPQLDLKDLRWISPDFPDMTGSANVSALSESVTRSSYVLEDLHLRHGQSTIDGSVTAIVDTRRGIGVHNMDVELRNVNLDIVRPYLDTLPLDGTLTGKLEANGFLDTLAVNIDLAFDDARIVEGARSRLTAKGDLHLGGPAGPVFDKFAISVSDFDLRSIRLISPAVRLNGNAQLAGTLNGPWKNVVFDGRAEHHEGPGAVSAVDGRVRLDTRGAVLGLESDLMLDPIDFNGIRGSFPALTLKGELAGRVRTTGDLSSLGVDVDVHGQVGNIRAVGVVTLQPPHMGADSLDVQFSAINLAAISDSGMPTDLNGHAMVSMSVDTLRAPEGSLLITLDSSRVRQFLVDSLRTELAIRDSVIHLDTLEVDWGGSAEVGHAAGSGTLGWASPHTGQMNISATAGTLAPFDSLLMVMTGSKRDTMPNSAPLGGSAVADFILSGSLDSIQATGQATVQDFRWQSIRTPGAVANVEWNGGHRARAAIALRSDSILVGSSAYRTINVQVAGWTDSLAWAGSMQAGSLAELSGGGRWWQPGAKGWVLSLDSLTAALPENQWRLAAPADIEMGSDVIRFSQLELQTSNGAGMLRVSGELPRNNPGTLAVTAREVPIRDIYSLMQRDTSGVAGALGMDMEFGGTASNPTITGTGSLGDLILGDFRAPFVEGVFDYKDRRLDANLLLWRTGVQVLRVEARLPIDLALKGVERRQLPGDLYIHAEADSVNLALLEAFTPNVRKVAGLLRTDVEVTGSWETPRLQGFLEVINGAATIPNLGVRYGYMNGRFNFEGDSIVVDHFRTTSGQGDLQLNGSIRLEGLTRPRLNLGLSANNFLAINSPTFLTLEVSGNGSLEGPVYGATLRGNIVANSGVLHFADLISKRIVNLSDPSLYGLIDTTLIRTEGLGAAFQSVFLDSLNIRDMRLTVQDQFWLRSSDANVQLEGAVVVNKTAKNYRFDGTFTALRGTYTLHIGFVARDFQVDRGTVRYFGSQDLNAELDLQATHVVSAQGEDIPIIARITGTLLLPKLSLESSIRPAPTESELVSYLMFGRPSPELPGIGITNASQQQAALETGLAYLGSALSSEIQRTVVSDLGIPIDFFEIRTGGGNLFSGVGTNQVTAGWQLGRKTFLTVNAGFCQNFSNLGVKSFGTGIEYRLNRLLRLQTSYEPVINCRPSGSSQFNQGLKYQFGIDALWEKEY